MLGRIPLGYLTSISVARDAWRRAASSGTNKMARFHHCGIAGVQGWSLHFTIANVTAESRFSVARISPRWSTCQDFLAQMNLVASMLSQSRWAT